MRKQGKEATKCSSLDVSAGTQPHNQGAVLGDKQGEERDSQQESLC